MAFDLLYMPESWLSMPLPSTKVSKNEISVIFLDPVDMTFPGL
jgi:hypothetical protein